MLSGIGLLVVLGITGFIAIWIAGHSSPEAVVRTQGIFSILKGIFHAIFAVGVLFLITGLVKKGAGPSIEKEH